MADPYSVPVPLVNPNENEVIIAQLCVHEGQLVKVGQLLGVFETTKSTFELTAEKSGFVLGLTSREGDLLRTGDPFCYIAESANQKPPLKIDKELSEKTQKREFHAGLRITDPALKLAMEHGVSLDLLPKNQLITEKTILAMISVDNVLSDPNALIIYGGGGHAKSLIDLIHVEGRYQIVGVIDDALPVGSKVLNVPVLGGGGMLPELRKRGISLAVNAVGGIGNIAPRLQVYKKMKTAGFSFPNVIHPRAFVEPTAKLGTGGEFFFNAYIGSDVQIGFGCIVNTSAVVSHDCKLEDYINISPGALLAGAVTICERALIGMGVTVNLGVTIGAGARVGNSAVVKNDVPENGIVRAGSVWPVDK
jgi:acetyltransferase EpsM